jgi:hypothetical protein
MIKIPISENEGKLREKAETGRGQLCIYQKTDLHRPSRKILTGFTECLPLLFVYSLLQLDSIKLGGWYFQPPNL